MIDKDKKFILNLKEIDEKNYLSVSSQDKLILFVVNFLEENHIEPRLDHISIAAFKLFPKRFSLPLYSEYPDVLRVDHCLLHCSYGKKWLDGGIKSGFRLNEKGKFILREFEKELKKEKKLDKKKMEKNIFKGAVNRKEKAIINEVMKTKAYSYFVDGKILDLDKDYLKEALRCTPEASKEKLKNNYQKIKRYASEINAEKEFFNFLKKLKEILDI